MVKLSSRVVFAVGIALVAFAALSSAFSLHASADSEVITACSDGTVHVWVTGATPGEKLYFSASSNIIGASFDASELTVANTGSKGTDLHLSVPACFIGSKNVDITAQVCGATCETQTVAVNLLVRPCEAVCREYVFLDQNYASSQAASCGETDCNRVLSNIHYRSYYEPSTYSVSIKRTTPNYCFDGRRCDYHQANAAGRAIATYQVTNKGAAGSFTLGVESSNPEVGVIPSKTYFDLDRNSDVLVQLNIDTGDAVPSIYAYEATVYKDGRPIGSITDRVEVTGAVAQQTSNELALVFPQLPASGLSVLDCQTNTISLAAQLENTLQTTADFAVDVFVSGRQISSRSLRVPSGVVAEFGLDVNRADLASGQNYLFVRATTPGWQGNGTIPIFVGSCDSHATAMAATSQSDRTITIIATIANDGPVALPNVSGRLESVPASWKVSSDTVTVPAGGERNVTITAVSDTNEEIAPTLVLESNGVEIARQRLDTVNKPQGITGLFFAAASENAFAIVVIIVVAFLVFALYSRSSKEDNARKQDAEYREKIRRIRQEILKREAAGDSATPSTS